ncbi:MAG: addiction module protein [Pseudomonadota bacterium]|nr:addiction module protein [Pseudomonadota bacterium]
MEKIELPLEEFTVAQKLGLLEAIWTNLADDEDRFESPAWHEAVIEDRKMALKAGKITVSDWQEAKNRIRKKVSCG